MAPRARKEPGRMPKDNELGCCRVESVISIDDRGQMVKGLLGPVMKEIVAK
jgi:hypothetical protein